MWQSIADTDDALVRVLLFVVATAMGFAGSKIQYCANTLCGPPLLESDNAAMVRAVAMARQVAASEIPVLLTGESGTGKHVLAAAIHGWSPCRSGPFVIVPRAALAAHPSEGVHMAYLDEGWDRYGWLKVANGGTVFFDEIADLAPAEQSKLVRFFDEHRLEVGGEETPIEADVRVIAASARDIEAEIRAGRFRTDLLFRLNIVSIALPPLRERAQDIPKLTDHLLARLSVHYHREPLHPAADVRALLARYPWPGNVRELQSVLERAVVLARGDTIVPEDLPQHLWPPAGDSGAPPSRPVSLRDLKRQHIERAIRESPTLEDAAIRLGIDSATLWRKRKQYGLT